MSDSIDHEPARAANSLAAIVIESDRIFTLCHELFVEHIEHLQKGHVRTHLRVLVADDAANLMRAFLPPDVEDEFHLLVAPLRRVDIFKCQRFFV